MQSKRRKTSNKEEDTGTQIPLKQMHYQMRKGMKERNHKIHPKIQNKSIKAVILLTSHMFLMYLKMPRTPNKPKNKNRKNVNAVQYLLFCD